MNSQKIELPLLSVTQLTQAIKLNLETMFPNIYLQGEISNLKVQSSGHIYFTLKDANAQISAVMFKTETTFLKRIPKAGDHVMVKAGINVYPPKGNYQLVVRELSFMGLGELLQKLEELKIKLHQQGWFKSARKKPLPRFPKRIGVVTSPTGAVIQDILHILTRRYPGFHLILNPVKVQGEGAAHEIAQAITQFNSHHLADVIIIGRGGGSLEDLWAFNEEIVAEAIYSSNIPIISAVGHETDHCIADYVADLRAPTPSAAAEIVIPERNQLLEYLLSLKKRMQHSIAQLVSKDRSRLKSLMLHPLWANPFSVIEWRMQRLDDFRADLNKTIQRCIQFKIQAVLGHARHVAAYKPANQINHLKQRLKDLQTALLQAAQAKIYFYRQKSNRLAEFLQQNWHRRIVQFHYALDKTRSLKRLDEMMLDKFYAKRQKLMHLERLFEAFDPNNLLKKGYSILMNDKEPSYVINSIKQILSGQQIKVLLSDGELLVTVNGIKNRTEDKNSF